MVDIVPVDDTWVRVECDDAVARELSDYFSFDAPGAQFMRRQPRYRKWDGKVRLFKLNSRTIYRGLVPRILAFCTANDYPVANHVPLSTPHAGLSEALDALQTTLPYELRDYQTLAVQTLLDSHRGIVVSPTGSGKSLIIYTLLRLLGLKTLVVVPTIGLVTQLEADFRDYHYTAPIHGIKGGVSKDCPTDFTISTWQSIYDQPKEWFAQFGCIVVDEVHLCKAKSLTGLMERCTTIPYRFGTTGTLDNSECHRLILEGLFGTVTKVATTAALVKAKQLTPPRVIVCVLSYPDAVKKQMREANYVEEIDFLCQYGTRNKFIAGLCSQMTGPTLTLFQLVVKHGASLFARVKQIVPRDRQVWYIDGKTSAEQREAIRLAIGASEDDILLASYGTTQLGINIPALTNLILAHPSKSLIRVLQSIGRILRLSDDKVRATVIDVVDDLRIGKHVNHTFRHAEQRMLYYAAEKFPVTLKHIDLAAVAML